MTPRDIPFRGEGSGIDRRLFLCAGTTAAVLASFGLSVQAAQAANMSMIRYVVTDKRHPESLAFGRVLIARGATRIEITDGLTKAWQSVLSPHWEAGIGTTAGLTSPGVWNGLSEQALGQWRRPMLVGRHFIDPVTASSAHALASTSPKLAASNLAGNSDGRWSQSMAMRLLQMGAAPRCGDTQWVGAGRPDADARQLVSWIIR